MNKIVLAITLVLMGIGALVAGQTIPLGANKIWNHQNMQRQSLYDLNDVYWGDNDTNTMLVKAPDNLAADTTVFIFPALTGDANKVLYSTGSGSHAYSLITDSLLDPNAAIDWDKIDAVARITDSNVSATAAIAYTKLNLTDTIVNADINSAAAIGYSKLNLTNTIIDADIKTGAAIDWDKISASGVITDANVNASAAIAYSKLNLTGNLVDADVSASAAIDWDKLSVVTRITDANVNASAAISWSKINKTGSVLDDIGDVNVPSPENGQAVIWDSTTSKWIVGASGDSSFKMQSSSGDTVTVKSGVRKRDGVYWCTYDGAGTASTDFTSDLVVDVSAISGDAYAANTEYYIYADNATASLITRTDDLFVCRAIENTHFYRSTADPDTISGSRYMLLGSFRTDSGPDVDVISPLIPMADDSFKNLALVNDADWVSFTPTGSWSTNTTYTGFYKRVGDEMFIRVSLALAGAPNATALTIDMPAGFVVDTTKLPNTSSNRHIGKGSILDSGTNIILVSLRYNTTTKMALYYHDSTGVPVAYSTNINATSPITFASSDEVHAEWHVPIVGWTTSTDAAATPFVNFNTRITSKNTSGLDSKHRVTGLPGGFSGRKDYSCTVIRHDDGNSHDFPIEGAVYNMASDGNVDLNLDAYTVSSTDYVDLVCGFGARVAALPLGRHQSSYTADLGGLSGTSTEHTITNLIIGKEYIVHWNVSINGDTVATHTGQFDIVHDSVILATSAFGLERTAGNSPQFSIAMVTSFTATTTTTILQSVESTGAGRARHSQVLVRETTSVPSSLGL